LSQSAGPAAFDDHVGARQEAVKAATIGFVAKMYQLQLFASVQVSEKGRRPEAGTIGPIGIFDLDDLCSGPAEN
jgi:hypothetical protein